jgi:hypothetical protein
LILWAKAGVKRLAVDGSDRRSYAELEKVSYMERVAAKVILFFIALKLEVLAAEAGPPLESNVVERAGADEFAVG